MKQKKSLPLVSWFLRSYLVRTKVYLLERSVGLLSGFQVSADDTETNLLRCSY